MSNGWTQRTDGSESGPGHTRWLLRQPGHWNSGVGRTGLCRKAANSSITPKTGCSAWGRHRRRGPGSGPDECRQEIRDGGSRCRLLPPCRQLQHDTWRPYRCLCARHHAGGGERRYCQLVHGSADAIPAVGGAMDLVQGVKHIYVITQHTTKTGEPKLVERCSYPLTGPVSCHASIPTLPWLTSPPTDSGSLNWRQASLLKKWNVKPARRFCRRNDGCWNLNSD